MAREIKKGQDVVHVESQPSHWLDELGMNKANVARLKGGSDGERSTAGAIVDQMVSMESIYRGTPEGDRIHNLRGPFLAAALPDMTPQEQTDWTKFAQGEAERGFNESYTINDNTRSDLAWIFGNFGLRLPRLRLGGRKRQRRLGTRNNRLLR